MGVLAGAAILFGNCVGAGIFISPRGNDDVVQMTFYSKNFEEIVMYYFLLFYCTHLKIFLSVYSDI